MNRASLKSWWQQNSFVQAQLQPKLERLFTDTPSPGLLLLFGSAATALYLDRGQQERAAAQLNGLSGDYVLTLTGRGGGSMTVRIAEKRVVFLPKASAEPTATVSMSVADFFRVLQKQSTMMTLQMTGRMRTSGSGHGAMVIAGLLTLAATAAAQPRLQGRLTKRLFALCAQLSALGVPAKNTSSDAQATSLSSRSEF